jgi:hypothetical protein
MLPEFSHVIRSLDADEISNFTLEIEKNRALFLDHPINKNKRAFHGGKSITLNWVTWIEGKYQLQWTSNENLPYAWNFITNLAEGKPIGKVYWHNMPPGSVALPHSDVRNPYIVKGDLYKRYNVYLSIPKETKFKFDDTEDIWDNSTFENTLFDVSTIKFHSVDNRLAKESMVALVIDILNEGVVVHDDLWNIQTCTEIDEEVKEKFPNYYNGVKLFTSL